VKVPDFKSEGERKTFQRHYRRASTFYFVIGGSGGLLGAGITNGSQKLIFGCLVLLFFNYLLNRWLLKKSSRISEATLSIKAEPNVSWTVVSLLGEYAEGLGAATLLIEPERCNLSGFLPERFTYKPHISYTVYLEPGHNSDLIEAEMVLGSIRAIGEKDESGGLGICIFEPSIHQCRNWIWPDWFEIFARKPPALSNSEENSDK
jgi:hypothetical protein